jgi:drug/metabolite transporter (DMT)-like permease
MTGTPPASSLRRPYDNAWLLLTITTLCWAGNAIASRLAVGEISPMALVCLRWIIGCAALYAITWRQFHVDWPVIRTHGPVIVLMGALGFTAFNALFYVAAHHTTAVNLTIIQGAIPVFTMIGALLVFGTAIRGLQIVGILVTLAGILVVATHGEWGKLLALTLNTGDLYMLVCCLLYAGFALALKRRPPVSGAAFLTALSFVAFLTSLPLLAWEVATHRVVWPTVPGWLVVAYVALFPSLIAQFFFMRGVELIGPARAGLFINLVPVFGALMAVGLLGEPFGWHHLLALALVLGGIWLAERGR